LTGISPVHAAALGLVADDDTPGAIIGYSVTMPDGHTSFFPTRRDAEEYRAWYLRVKTMVGDPGVHPSDGVDTETP